MDLYHDPGHAQLSHLIEGRPGLTPFLKDASFEESVDQLPSDAFAWGARREYPIHTPEHAVVSYLYAEADDRVPVTVKVAIEEALTAYGVPSTTYARQAPLEKTASAEDYLFPEQRAYPVDSARAVRMAEARLLSQLPQLSFHERVPLFNKLAHAAHRHGVELRPVSQAYGLAAQSDAHQVAEALAVRMYQTKVASLREEYRRLGESVTSQPRELRKFTVRTKLAELLLRLDQEAGVTYGPALPDPFRTVFNAPIKLGAAGVLIGNASYDLGQLCGLPATFYQDALGPEVSGELAPGGQVQPELIQSILPTLPADMQAILAQALQSAGLRPTQG